MPEVVRSTDRRLPAGPLLAFGASVFLALTTEVLPIGVLSSIADDLDVTAGAAGLLVSAYAVVVMVGSVPLALLLARWPRRWVLFWLLLGYAITSIGFALAPSYPIALITRLLAGAVHAAFFASVFAAVVDVSPRALRGRGTAMVSLGVTGGLALGVPGGAALSVAVGWRGAFLVLSALLVVAAVATLRVLRSQPPRAVEEEGDRAGAGAAGIAIVVVLIVVLTLGHYTPYTYIDVLLQDGSVPFAAVAAVLFAYGAGAALGSGAAGFVADRAPRRGLVVAVALIATALVVLASAPPLVGTVIATCAWGAGFGTSTPLLQSIALQITSPDLASALVNASFNAGIAGGGVVGAALLASGTSTLALVGTALVVLSLGALALTARLGVRPSRRD
jgi:MFS transporter, DHA1 family, inner membrane transport protein